MKSPRPAAPRTAAEMMAMARSFLERKGIAEARLEAELLVAHALGTDRMGLYLDLQRPIVDREVDFARDLLVRRGRREPLAYITGRREFYGRAFRVGPGVLVPRPETELIVDLARQFERERDEAPAERERDEAPAERERDEAPAERERRRDEAARETLHVLDVGTGSGCLAVTLALELRAPRVTALDLSATALVYTETNARELGASLQTLLGDGPEAARAGAPFDLIVCNPPYVDPGQRATLPPEIADHEPAEALFTPEGDPDHWACRLLDAAPHLLVPGGLLLVELAAGQGERVLEEARRRGFDSRLVPDLAGIPRVLSAGRRASAGAPVDRTQARRSAT